MVCLFKNKKTEPQINISHRTHNNHKGSGSKDTLSLVREESLGSLRSVDTEIAKTEFSVAPVQFKDSLTLNKD